MRVPERIALVGFMGSGKTTVGRILAARLGYDFVDTDIAIESATGMKAAELFAKRGEPFFRQREREVLSQLVQGARSVIATGGGTFADEACAQVLLSSSWTVFLECDFEEAYRRATASGGRPLLENGRIAAAALYADRKDKYARAHVMVGATHRVPEDVASAVLTAFP